MSGFSGCKWCYGKGCNQCHIERKKHEAELKNPQPTFTARRDNPHDMALLKRFFGKDAMEHAFGPDGDGSQEMEENGAIASLMQVLHNQNKPPEEGS